MSEKGIVVTINQEITKELSNPSVARALLATTFRGLDELKMRQALMEGMIRGYKFKDFLVKNIYAIPFADGYSLITSIDNARKIGMRSGVVGTSSPKYEYDKDGKIVSCEITVKRKIGDYIGEYSALVFFDEYYKTNKHKNSLWDTKPKTMIAKVAEMHALRKACPEELSQIYDEAEFDMGRGDNFSERFINAKVEGEKLKTKIITKDNDEEKNEEDIEFDTTEDNQE